MGTSINDFAAEIYGALFENNLVTFHTLLQDFSKEDVKRFLSRHINIINEWNTPLGFAIETFNLGFVEYLLKDCQVDYSRSCKIANTSYRNSYYHAISKENTDILKVFNTLRNDVNSCSDEWSESLVLVQPEIVTPLKYACFHGKPKAVQYLLDEVGVKASSSEPLIMYAAASDSLKLVEYLNSKEHVDSKNAEGRTALHIASRHGKLEIVRHLLKLGAVMTKDNFGLNPLCLAALHSQEEVVRFYHDTCSLNEQEMMASLALLGGSLLTYGRREETFKQRGLNCWREVLDSNASCVCEDTELYGCCKKCIYTDLLTKFSNKWERSTEQIHKAYISILFREFNHFNQYLGYYFLEVFSDRNDIPYEITCNLLLQIIKGILNCFTTYHSTMTNIIEQYLICMHDSFHDRDYDYLLDDISEFFKVVDNTELSKRLWTINNIYYLSVDVIVELVHRIYLFEPQLLKGNKSLDHLLARLSQREFLLTNCGTVLHVLVWLRKGITREPDEVISERTRQYYEPYIQLSKYLCVKYPHLINWPNEDLETPLHLAILTGDDAMINLLSSQGASIHSTNKNGESIISRAVSRNKTHFLKLLSLKQLSLNVVLSELDSCLKDDIDRKFVETMCKFK